MDLIENYEWNMRFLKLYKHLEVGVYDELRVMATGKMQNSFTIDELAEKLSLTFQTRFPIKNLSLSTVYHFIGTGRIACNLTLPLTNQSSIVICQDNNKIPSIHWLRMRP